MPDIRASNVTFCPLCGEPRLQWLTLLNLHICRACRSAFDPIKGSSDARRWQDRRSRHPQEARLP